MTLRVVCLLKNGFSDCFNAEKAGLKMSAHQIIVGYYPIPVKLRKIFLLRVFVKVLQNETWRMIYEILILPFHKQQKQKNSGN